MTNCSALLWLAWLAVFYRKEFHGKLFTVASRFSVELRCLLGGDWPITPVPVCMSLHPHGRLPGCYSFTFATPFSSYSLFSFPLQLATLSLTFPAILHFPSPDCQSRTVLGKERKRKKPSMRFLLHLLFLISDNFPRIHYWIMATSAPLISFLSTFWIFILLTNNLDTHWANVSP